jgi:hypothetical protein
MKAIKFSESELEFLQDHYELELLDAENYVGEIKNILKKLGAIEEVIVPEKPVKKAGKKPGRPKTEKKAVAEKPVVVKAVAAKVTEKAPKAAKKVAKVKTVKAPVAKPVKKSPKKVVKASKSQTSATPVQTEAPKSV